jgi:hypothetical protein
MALMDASSLAALRDASRRERQARDALSRVRRAQALGRNPWFPVFNELVESGLLATLSPCALRVYLAFICSADRDTAKSWLGLKKMAQRVGRSEPWVRKAYAELKGHGLIRRRRIRRPNGCQPYETRITRPEEWEPIKP